MAAWIFKTFLRMIKNWKCLKVSFVFFLTRFHLSVPPVPRHNPLSERDLRNGKDFANHMLFEDILCIRFVYHRMYSKKFVFFCFFLGGGVLQAVRAICVRNYDIRLLCGQLICWWCVQTTCSERTCCACPKARLREAYVLQKS